MRVVLTATSITMFVFLLGGVLGLFYTVLGAYMVAAGYAIPGEPIYLDELAPTYQEAIVQCMYPIAIICVAWLIRKVCDRKLATLPGNPSTQSNTED